MSYGISCRHGLDHMLLWLWCRLAAAAPIDPYPGNLHMPWVWPLEKKKLQIMELVDKYGNLTIINILQISKKVEESVSMKDRK